MIYMDVDRNRDDDGDDDSSVVAPSLHLSVGIHHEEGASWVDLGGVVEVVIEAQKRRAAPKLWFGRLNCAPEGYYSTRSPDQKSPCRIYYFLS